MLSPFIRAPEGEHRHFKASLLHCPQAPRHHCSSWVTSLTHRRPWLLTPDECVRVEYADTFGHSFSTLRDAVGVAARQSLNTRGQLVGRLPLRDGSIIPQPHTLCTQRCDSLGGCRWRTPATATPWKKTHIQKKKNPHKKNEVKRRKFCGEATDGQGGAWSWDVGLIKSCCHCGVLVTRSRTITEISVWEDSAPTTHFLPTKGWGGAKKDRLLYIIPRERDSFLI